MKLIIFGATGFVGTELLRQSLLRKDITSVVAVSRRALPASSSSPKLTSVIVKDYDEYSPEDKRAFEGANGCIWTIAITPSKSTLYPFPEVVRVCQTHTLLTLRTLLASNPGTPFRYVYMSGSAAERDQTATPSFKPEYCLMRGDTENKLLSLASSHPGLSLTVAKPGLITSPGYDPASLAKRAMAAGLRATMGLPSIGVQEVCVAMLEQVVKGIEKEPLTNEDLVRIAAGTGEEGE